MQAAPRPDPLLEIVRYGNEVRGLGEEALMQQYRNLAFAGPYLTSDAQIRLALLLSAANAPFPDVERAVNILDGVVGTSGLAEHAELASLLSALLSEQMAATARNEVLATLLGEARDRNEDLQQQLAAATSELETTRARAETLQGQLDALRRLEEQISNDLAERQ